MIRSILLAGALLCGAVWAQEAPPPSTPAKPGKTDTPATRSSTPSGQSSVPRTPSRYHPDRFAGRAGSYYRLVWGVDSLAVKWVESGEVLRFTYRVLDPNKASALTEKQNEQLLIAQ